MGLRRALAADTAVAALAGASDGRLGVGTLVAAVQQVLGEEPLGDERYDAELLDRVHDLVQAGVLLPPV